MLLLGLSSFAFFQNLCSPHRDDKDLVHEFVVAEGLTCLIKVGAEADQNYQNYILREACASFDSHPQISILMGPTPGMGNSTELRVGASPLVYFLGHLDYGCSACHSAGVGKEKQPGWESPLVSSALGARLEGLRASVQRRGLREDASEGLLIGGQEAAICYLGHERMLSPVQVTTSRPALHAAQGLPGPPGLCSVSEDSG
ncbi:hypothetical protein CB1_000669016 [Camelus ferus]|nr:hypothetical protein CB1_000669016 [Camelus ferus]